MFGAAVSDQPIASNAVTIADVSGHKEFVKNMVTGTSKADVMLVFVSAALGEFEAGFGQRGEVHHLLL
jgi:elongation factor 1-alpha